MPADHAEIPVWNAENWFYDDFEIGHRIRSLRRTISEGESQQFNALVLDFHPYVTTRSFAETEGLFGRRLVAGAFVFSAGPGWSPPIASTPFSYVLRPAALHQAHLHRRHDLHDPHQSGQGTQIRGLGLIRASYEVFKGEGELVLYCEHIQTVKYRDKHAARLAG